MPFGVELFPIFLFRTIADRGPISQMENASKQLKMFVIIFCTQRNGAKNIFI